MVMSRVFSLEVNEEELFTIFCSLVSRSKTDFEPANKQIVDMISSIWGMLPTNLRNKCEGNEKFKCQLDYWGVLSFN